MMGEWQCHQTGSKWEVVVPVRPNTVNPDDIRVGVTSTSFNVHILGQHNGPLLAGETYRRIYPADCRWWYKPTAKTGPKAADEIVIKLAKEESESWKDLIKTWYV